MVGGRCDYHLLNKNRFCKKSLCSEMYTSDPWHFNKRQRFWETHIIWYYIIKYYHIISYYILCINPVQTDIGPVYNSRRMAGESSSSLTYNFGLLY